MQNMHDLLRDDASRMFLDWGEPAQFLEVHRRYDVETGRLEESKFAAEICVIRSENHPQQPGDLPATIGQRRQLLLVQQRDIPPQAPLTSARVVLSGTPYEIRSVSESQHAGITVLECVTSGLIET